MIFWLVAFVAIYLIATAPLWLFLWWATGTFVGAQFLTFLLAWSLLFALSSRK